MKASQALQDIFDAIEVAKKIKEALDKIKAEHGKEVDQAVSIGVNMAVFAKTLNGSAQQRQVFNNIYDNVMATVCPDDKTALVMMLVESVVELTKRESDCAQCKSESEEVLEKEIMEMIRTFDTIFRMAAR